MDYQKIRLDENFSTHNICFGGEMKKITFNYVPGGLFMPNKSSIIQIFVYMEAFVVVPTGGVSMRF